ncbi:MAG: MFS transporter, partial [Alphaproteobacteria bacterium]|nr:MFS transporter [Alphaproteobacteria bacterium]
YDKIGIFAPIILILARILQGISASGEIQGAKIYAMETVDPKSLGTTAGIMSAAGGVGVMMAMVMGYLSSVSDYENAWRFPFLLGSLIGYVGIMLRREQIKAKYEQHTTPKKAKIWDLVGILKQYKYESVAVFSLGAILGSVSYMLHAFMNPYMVSLGISSDKAYLLTIISLVSTATFSVVSGIYSDMTSRLVGAMKNNIYAIILVIIPAFMMILSMNIMLIEVACAILGGLLGVNATMCGIIMYKSFPYEARCRGVMFLYALSVSIFGGFTPIILKYSANFDKMMPAYIMLGITVSMLVAFKSAIKKIKLYE